jgi:beta-xylosidase
MTLMAVNAAWGGEPHPSTTRPQPRVAYPWSPDQSDDTYLNPILCADYSDPDVVRDGDDFWLTASSFNCTPGLPILHSRDLVNWTIVNHAVRNLPDPRKMFDQPRHGEGVWAPAIRKHDRKFFIYFPMPDEGIYVVTADDPRGKWSEPRLVIEGKGLIDPCPLWDDDGKAYLVHAYARSRSGIKHVLRVRPMSPDGMSLLGEGQVVYNDPENQPTLEGPKFQKRDGWYYISAPAGGVPTGWQLILRSKNVYGPYEPKKVLEQGDSPINGPHQGAIIDSGDGKEWWFVHFQETQPYGRIVHLQPVEWRDGWPLMGENGQPVLRHAKPKVAGEVKVATPQTSDDFDGESLGLQWQWHANHKDDWASLSARKGWLRLRAISSEADFSKTPNLLLQKLPAREFRAETELEVPPKGQAGLIVMGKSHAALVVEGGAVELLVDNKKTASLPVAAESVRLRVDMADGGACGFAVSTTPGQWQEVGQLFQAVEGVWIGAKVGLFCRGGGDGGVDGATADFDYFRFSKP